jgi:hypothetical protein
MKTLKEVSLLCKNKYDIDHLTIQMEDSNPNNEHAFECEQTTHKKLEF